LRIVFFGSSDFAIPALRSLVQAGRTPALVVTKPDAPRGRGRKIYDNEVKLGAAELGLPCAQPEDPHSPEFLEQLRAIQPDVGVVISYGVLLKPSLLTLPKQGHINAHASLLPLYRGAAPIQHAIWDGRTETGVTIMRIVEKLDAGPVLLTEATPIGANENAGALRERLAALSGTALVKALQVIAAGKAKYEDQDDSKATYARKISKSEALLDWNSSPQQLDRAVRAFNPHPGAHSVLRGVPVKIWAVQAASGRGRPGEVLAVAPEAIRVACGTGQGAALDLLELQRPGGRRLPVAEFLKGFPVAPGECFDAGAPE
jgi:methionyl-tRNA formyltransferase